MEVQTGEQSVSAFVFNTSSPHEVDPEREINTRLLSQTTGFNQNSLTFFWNHPDYIQCSGQTGKL